MKKTLITAALAAAAITAAAGHRTRFISHRGECFLYPNNTMAAYRAAVENGADGIELDVHLTKDDGIICLHDATTKGTCGVELKPIDATVAELKTLNAGWYKGPQFKEQLPTLQEALVLARDNFEIIVEIKEVPVSKLHVVAAAVKAEPKATPERVLFHCFNTNVVAELRRQLPEYRTYWLSGLWAKKGEKPTVTIEELIAQAKACNASGINLNDNEHVTAETVKAVKAAGMTCHIWTCDNVLRAREYIAMGIDSIITNSGAMIKQLLGVKPQDNPQPLIHWTFDGDARNSGTGGARYDAAVQGTAEYVEGRLGKGLRLDGTGNGAASVPLTGVASGALSLPLTGTIALWYKPESFNHDTVFDNALSPYHWKLWIAPDGQLTFRQLYPQNTLACDLNALGGPGRWYHIAVTWGCMDAAPGSLYVDGVERDVKGNDTWWHVPGPAFYIGGGPGNKKAKGVVDDMRIYDSPLTGKQVKELFESGSRN